MSREDVALTRGLLRENLYLKIQVILMIFVNSRVLRREPVLRTCSGWRLGILRGVGPTDVIPFTRPTNFGGEVGRAGPT